jgi:hypothetical protein
LWLLLLLLLALQSAVWPLWPGAGGVSRCRWLPVLLLVLRLRTHTNNKPVHGHRNRKPQTANAHAMHSAPQPTALATGYSTLQHTRTAHRPTRREWVPPAPAPAPAPSGRCPGSSELQAHQTPAPGRCMDATGNWQLGYTGEAEAEWRVVPPAPRSKQPRRCQEAAQAAEEMRVQIVHCCSQSMQSVHRPGLSKI